jgi:hypothetical protein
LQKTINKYILKYFYIIINQYFIGFDIGSNALNTTDNQPK